jgi:hypothetical protein
MKVLYRGEVFMDRFIPKSNLFHRYFACPMIRR